MFDWIVNIIKYFLSYLPMFSYNHVEGLGSTVKDFNAKFDSDGDKARRSNYQNTTETFYNLITDFYEWGWGQSFHFAPRYDDEGFHESIKRYEHEVASLLNIPLDPTSLSKKTYKVLDVGCGVGGPLRSVSKFFKGRVHITGINITAEHINRANRYNKKAGVENVTLEVGDFNAIKHKDNTFDAIYDFEATLHSTDRLKTFKEINRVLKPGGRYVTAQYCLLAPYDAKSEYHQDIIRRVDNTNGCYCADQTIELTTSNLKKAGFNIISSEDVFDKKNGSDIPFHEVFEGARGGRFTGTKFGTYCTWVFTYVGEKLKLLPKGTNEVQTLLMGAAESFKEAGREGILTPGYLFVCEKQSK